MDANGKDRKAVFCRPDSPFFISHGRPGTRVFYFFGGLARAAGIDTNISEHS
jgi:hypothetical protein